MSDIFFHSTIWEHTKDFFNRIGLWKTSFILIVILAWIAKPRFDYTSLDSDDFEDPLFPFLIGSLHNSIFDFIIQVFVPIWCTLQAPLRNDFLGTICSSLDSKCSDCTFISQKINRLSDTIRNKADIKELNRITIEVETLRDDFIKLLTDLRKLKDDQQTVKLSANNHKSCQQTNHQCDQSNVTSKIQRLLEKQNKKIELLDDKCSVLDDFKNKDFMVMFQSAEASVDFIRKRDDQLKELFKTTTDLVLKYDKVNEEMRSIRLSFDDILEQILRNNEDYVKFVEYCGSVVEDSVIKKTKQDLLKFTTEFEQLRADNVQKMSEVSKLEDTVVNLGQSYLKIQENQNKCEEKISQFSKMIGEFEDEIEKMSVLLNTDIAGKIHGILKFMGKTVVCTDMNVK